jgi:hypothetical protein
MTCHFKCHKDYNACEVTLDEKVKIYRSQIWKVEKETERRFRVTVHSVWTGALQKVNERGYFT